jgi:transcriptional regulator with GAF, ATPase, and Fis domain
LGETIYRLHVIPIVVPPLRERVEDMPMLAAYFADKHAARSGTPIDALEEGWCRLSSGITGRETCVSSKTRTSAPWC